VLSVISAKTGRARYYTDPRSSFGDHVEAELARPTP
jgi:hypothetical protein